MKNLLDVGMTSIIEKHGIQGWNEFRRISHPTYWTVFKAELLKVVQLM